MEKPVLEGRELAAGARQGTAPEACPSPEGAFCEQSSHKPGGFPTRAMAAGATWGALPGFRKKDKTGSKLLGSQIERQAFA